jgi:hypothetical protein
MPGECPINYPSGLFQLKGELTQAILNKVSVNGPPFIASFSPRGVAPLIYGTTIQESPDNTITYNSVKYQLVSTGFFLPSLTGYTLSKNYHILDLLLIYMTNQKVTGTYLPYIVISVPIYLADKSEHNAYIKQFIDKNNPAASLQTIFFNDKNDKSQVSIGFDTCLSGSNLRGFVFPRGILITYNELVEFAKIITNNNQTSINKLPGTTFPEVLVTSQDFNERFKYYLQPIQLTSTSGFSSSCPYYNTNQYKCMPFNRLHDLSGNQVIPGSNTLDTILKSKSEMGSIDASGSISTSDMLSMLGIGTGVILAAGVVTILGKYVLTALKSKPT